MRTKVCDIWVIQGTHAITIPTNMGWRGDGLNVMGKGLARQAALKCRRIPEIVGAFYRRAHIQRLDSGKRGINDKPPILSLHFAASNGNLRLREDLTDDGLGVAELVFVPSKRLVSPAYMSWRGDADIRLVRRSLRALKKKEFLKSKVAVPLIGAGNGGLSEVIVKSCIKEILGDDARFTLVLYNPRRKERKTRKKRYD
jgi:hypothetical protein